MKGSRGRAAEGVFYARQRSSPFVLHSPDPGLCLRERALLAMAWDVHERPARFDGEDLVR